jgi:hypothetical protein
VTNAVDNAIARVQDIALAMTTITIKSAPDYPIENVDPLPMVSTYLAGGQFRLTNATIHHNFPALRVEFHVSRVNLRQAYQQINAIALEFPKRLAGDPTLNGTITTVLATEDSPIAYEVRPFEWGQVTTQMIAFTIPIKTLQAPV